MDGENRRKTLLDLLAAAEEPLSGSALAKKLGVSRQVIVQDIALLRATNRDILSTARGYLLYTPHSTRRNRCFMEMCIRDSATIPSRLLLIQRLHCRTTGSTLCPST